MGRRVIAGALPCSLLLPLPYPPVQALCENLLWPPPEWGWPCPGGWEIMSPPSVERLVFAESNEIFNLRTCLEEFGFCDCLWGLYRPRRLYKLWGLWNQKWKKKWINEHLATNPSSWNHSRVSGSNQKHWQGDIATHKCDPQMGLVVFVTFCKAFFYIFFVHIFLCFFRKKCISEYIYSRTIHIFEVEPYECQ